MFKRHVRILGSIPLIALPVMFYGLNSLECRNISSFVCGFMFIFFVALLVFWIIIMSLVYVNRNNHRKELSFGTYLAMLAMVLLVPVIGYLALLLHVYTKYAFWG